MSRKRVGATLKLKAARYKPDGKLKERATWIIYDCGDYYSTGCAEDEIDRAETKLAEYLANKTRPERKMQDIEHITIADVLAIYDDDCREKQANKRTFDGRLIRLNDWWGGKMLSEVTGVTCRAYVAHRLDQNQKAGRKAGHGGVRRDLEDLRSAINHHAKEGLHRGVVRVWLPDKGEARSDWLTRAEAAKLLHVCWTYRERQRRVRGDSTAPQLPTARYTLRHLARFVLIGLYTGSRAATIAAASPVHADGRSWVDLDQGIFHRRQVGKKSTNKRQPTIPIPTRLLAHMRRWHRKKLVVSHFVEWNGKSVASVKTAFSRAVSEAGLPPAVTPHTLRHTAATWLMQSGVDLWEASGYLGMSVEMLQKVYGHHHPQHMRAAAQGITKRPGGG